MVRTQSGGWVGEGTSDNPNRTIVTRSMGGDHKVSFTLRLVKRFEAERSATIRACDGGANVEMRYLYEGRDVTQGVTSSGYVTGQLSPSSHRIRVVATGYPKSDGLQCPMRAMTAGKVLDSLTLVVLP